MEELEVKWPNKLVEEQTGAFGKKLYTTIVYASDLIEPNTIEKEEKQEEIVKEDLRNVVIKDGSEVNFNEFTEVSPKNNEKEDLYNNLFDGIYFN